MLVRVKLFGPEARLASCSQIELELDARPTCKHVRQALGEHCPALGDALAHARLAVNHDFASDDRVIEAGDELALIGLVSGG